MFKNEIKILLTSLSLCPQAAALSSHLCCRYRRSYHSHPPSLSVCSFVAFFAFRNKQKQFFLSTHKLTQRSSFPRNRQRLMQPFQSPLVRPSAEINRLDVESVASKYKIER